jgi:hypothetical protein
MYFATPQRTCRDSSQASPQISFWIQMSGLGGRLGLAWGYFTPTENQKKKQFSDILGGVK